MKKLIVMMLALIFCIAANAQSLSDLDAKYGYKNLRFDMSADSVMKVLKVFRPLAQIGSNKSNLYYYQLPSNYRRFAEFSFDGCSIAKIKNTDKIYSFNLSSVMSNQTKLSRLIEFFKSLYGDPTTTDVASHTWLWKGNEVELLISYDVEQSKSFLFPAITSENFDILISITSIKAREENRELLANKFSDGKSDF